MFYAGGSSPIALTKQLIYWSSSEINKGGKTVSSVIMSAPRSGPVSRPRIAVRNAGLPVASGNDLFFVPTPHLLPDPHPATYQIDELTPSGKTKRLVSRAAPRTGDVVELGASPDYLAWCFGPRSEAGGTLYVLNRHTGTLGSVQLASQDWTSKLSISGHYLAWGNGSSNGEGGEYLLNLDNHQLWKLGSSMGYSEAFVAGNTVIWAERKGNAITMVIARWLDS